MIWRVAAIGKPKQPYIKAGIDEYAMRLRMFTSIEMDYVKASTPPAEGLALLRRTEGTFRIVLDERGEQVSSREFAARISGWERENVKSVSLLVGGADGHGDAVRGSAGWVWSLSKLTLQHEMALLVLLEQIYRAYTIKAGLPYHRD